MGEDAFFCFLGTQLEMQQNIIVIFLTAETSDSLLYQ